jgi:crotonobetainyl-CoA:carnitine CoA-transferase CaiB-like acyl-CoA transferase
MRREGAIEDLDDPRYDDIRKLRGINSFLVSEDGQHALQVVARFIQSMGAERVYREAQRIPLSWARVFRPEETLNDAHFHERGFFQSMQLGPDGEQYLEQSLPWKIAFSDGSEPPSPAEIRAPALGEHTDGVLTEWHGQDPGVTRPAP